MAPKSSMEESRLTMTRSRAICVAPLASVSVTMAGSSCGVMPTARASEKSSESRTGRCRSTFARNTATISTSPTRTMSPPNERRPRSKLVGGSVVSSSSPTRPSSVRPPVATTMAAPEPLITCVPRKIELRRASWAEVASVSPGSLWTG